MISFKGIPGSFQNTLGHSLPIAPARRIKTGHPATPSETARWGRPITRCPASLGTWMRRKQAKPQRVDGGGGGGGGGVPWAFKRHQGIWLGGRKTGVIPVLTMPKTYLPRLNPGHGGGSWARKAKGLHESINLCAFHFSCVARG